MKLVTAIKRIVADYLENEAMADVIHATYTGTGLRLDDQQNEISADMVDIPLSLQTVEATVCAGWSGGFEISAKDGQGRDCTVEYISLTNAPITITRGLVPGDRVTAVRQRGGQRYSVIDRTADPGA